MDLARNRSARIERVRSQLKKYFGVQFVYVNSDTLEIFISDHDYQAQRREAALTIMDRGWHIASGLLSSIDALSPAGRSAELDGRPHSTPKPSTHIRRLLRGMLILRAAIILVNHSGLMVPR